MKKWGAYLAVLVTVILLQNLHYSGMDVSRLEPVEAVQVVKLGRSYCVSTDTGQFGSGCNMLEAIDDMLQTSDGTIFLDTAQYLLINQEAISQMNLLAKVLRPSCRICLAEKEIDVANVSEYLSVHKLSTTIRQFRIGEGPLEKLVQRQGRLLLVQP